MIFLLGAMHASFDPREVWERVLWADSDEGSRAFGRRAPEVAT